MACKILRHRIRSLLGRPTETNIALGTHNTVFQAECTGITMASRTIADRAVKINVGDVMDQVLILNMNRNLKIYNLPMKT